MTRKLSTAKRGGAAYVYVLARLSYDPSGRYGQDNLQRLAAEFATQPRPELTLKQQLVLSERQRSQLTERAERIAWVCAMVIGDRAIGHAGIDAHIYRGNEESERQDGAKAMRAALKRSSGGPRLHYFSLPNGTIEFAQIGYHDLALS